MNDEWYGSVPNTWNVAPLKIFCDEINEKNNPIKSTNILSLMKDIGVIPYEDKGNVGNTSKTDLSGYKIAYKNSIIINSMNVKIGSVGISEYDGCVSPAYYVYKIKDNCPCITRYINYIFQTREYQKYLGRYGKGIMEIREKVSSYDIKKSKIPYPDKDTQIKICDKLDLISKNIDDSIINIEKIIEKYKEYKIALISKAVTEGIHQTEKKKSELEHIGFYPNSWKEVRLKRILSESSERTENGEEEPLSMSQKYGLIPTKEMELIPNMASDFSNCKIVHVNDLVFNKLKAHLGVFAKSNYEGIVSPDYAVYKAKNGDNMLFLQYLFHTPKYINQFIRYSRGIGQGLTRLYTQELFNIKIALPSIKEQNEITEYIDTKCNEIDKIIEDKYKMKEDLLRYKKSIIYQYITGKKEV